MKELLKIHSTITLQSNNMVQTITHAGGADCACTSNLPHTMVPLCCS